MAHQAMSTRLATLADVDSIISISSRVQNALTASGSLQHIGPLAHLTVSATVEESRCFVIVDRSDQVFGCVMFRPIDQDYFASSPDFSITDFPEPWWYLHSMMLVPEVQGTGMGLMFFGDFAKHLELAGGTLLLDCWAGNDKLRNFYANAGCLYVATLPEEDYEIAVFVQSFRAVHNGTAARGQ